MSKLIDRSLFYNDTSEIGACYARRQCHIHCIIAVVFNSLLICVVKISISLLWRHKCVAMLAILVPCTKRVKEEWLPYTVCLIRRLAYSINWLYSRKVVNYRTRFKNTTVIISLKWSLWRYHIDSTIWFYILRQSECMYYKY